MWTMIGPWCYGLNWDPQNFCAEALSPNVTMFGEGAFKEVVKAGGWGLIRQDYPHKERERPQEWVLPEDEAP